MSGKVIYSLSVSLDGFVETPDRSLDWVIVDEELHRFFNDQARETRTSLYGRRLYELMAAYWPTADKDPSTPDYMVEFSRIWKDKPKVVFSKTLDKVEWNSRLATGTIPEEMARLKEQPDNDMELGGPNLAATFMQLGLIDEYRLFVQPVVLGAGTPFFPPLDPKIDLRLVETKTFGSGVVYLRYERAQQTR
jgi:dihydrofolate reductase